MPSGTVPNFNMYAVCSQPKARNSHLLNGTAAACSSLKLEEADSRTAPEIDCQQIEEAWTASAGQLLSRPPRPQDEYTAFQCAPQPRKMFKLHGVQLVCVCELEFTIHLRELHQFLVFSFHLARQSL